MKKKATFLVFILSTTLLNAQLYNVTSRLQEEGVFSKSCIDSIVKYSSIFPNNTQLSFALVTSKKKEYYGILRKNDTLKYIDNHLSIFEIGSITKVFTSTLLANFAYNNIINLDSSIQYYIPFPIINVWKSGKCISLKTLANHTSGLPSVPSDLLVEMPSNPTNPYQNYDIDRLETYLKEKMLPKSVPSEKYKYSNLGYGILGYILCKVSGKNYETLLREIIFDPYNMNNTTSIRSSVKNIIVPGLDDIGNTTSNWDLNAIEPAGSILSNVEDLSKFIEIQFTKDKILTMQREKTFQISNEMDIALGWHIVKPEKNKILYFHNGGTGGYSSCMFIDLKKNTGIIILSNVSGLGPNQKSIDRLCIQLIKTIVK